jgi:hypothetical protein
MDRDELIRSRRMNVLFLKEIRRVRMATQFALAEADVSVIVISFKMETEQNFF